MDSVRGKAVEDERHLALSVMRFIYQILGKDLSKVLKIEFEEFEERPSRHYTDNVAKALFILCDQLFHGEEILKYESTIYKEELLKLRQSYNHNDFLNFAVCNGMKASLYRSDEISIEYFIDLVLTLELQKFDEGDWWEMDKSAKKIIKIDARKCKNIPEKYSERWIDMKMEEDFVLKAMAYVFELVSGKIPVFMQNMLSNLDVQENDPFTEKVKKALRILIHAQYETLDAVGWHALKNFHYNSYFESFKGRDFLELCACYLTKSVDDYYSFGNFKTPFKIYETLVTFLKCAKEEEAYFSLENIEYHSDCVIEEYAERKESQKEYRDLPSGSDCASAKLTYLKPRKRMNRKQARKARSKSHHEPSPSAEHEHLPSAEHEHLPSAELTDLKPSRRMNIPEDNQPLSRSSSNEPLLLRDPKKDFCACCKCS